MLAGDCPANVVNPGFLGDDAVGFLEGMQGFGDLPSHGVSLGEAEQARAGSGGRPWRHFQKS